MPGFPDLKTIEINGAKLAYHERGAGDPVVFVHGTSQDIRTWHAQLDDFAKCFRTIIYSRRYARPNEDIGLGVDDQMDPHVDDLVSLVRQLGAAPVHLVGNSWGGFIALLLAVRQPDIVKSLVLCEPPVLPLFISNEPRPTEILRLLVRRPIDAVRIMRFGLGVVGPTAKAYRADDIERANKIFGQAILGKEGFANLPAERQQMLMENSAAEAAQFLGAGFPPLSEREVKSVAAPTLLVAGKQSPAILRETLINALHRLMPNARRATIPAASHIMHEDNPPAFNNAVINFLRTVTPAVS